MTGLKTVIISFSNATKFLIKGKEKEKESI